MAANGLGRVVATGASAGIGETTALHLRQLGLSVLARHAATRTPRDYVSGG
jgi:NADP-dependent 3-hydroxy acid dehydrogenase YdfG